MLFSGARASPVGIALLTVPVHTIILLTQPHTSMGFREKNQTRPDPTRAASVSWDMENVIETAADLIRPMVRPIIVLGAILALFLGPLAYLARALGVN